MAAGYVAPQQGGGGGWLQSLIAGQVPGIGMAQMIPGVLGMLGGFFGGGRENSLQRYAEDLMRARFKMQDNVMQDQTAIARQNLDTGIRARTDFHKNEVAKATRELHQGIAATGAGPGADTRNDVYNAVIETAGTNALNRDTDALNQQYLMNLMNIQRPDVNSAMQLGEYGMVSGAMDDQAEQGVMNAILNVGKLIGTAMDGSRQGGQPSQPQATGGGGAATDFGSYYNGIFDLQTNDNLRPKSGANYMRWDTPSYGGMFG